MRTTAAVSNRASARAAAAARALRVAAAWALAGALLLTAATVSAHGLGMSQLRLRVVGSEIDGEWEIQVSDAQTALQLESPSPAEAGRDRVKEHEPELRRYLARHLALSSDGRDCPLELTEAPMEWQPDVNQVLFHLRATCPSEPTCLTVRCDLLLDRDPKHRAYYSVEDSRATQVGVFRDDRRVATIEVRQYHLGATFAEFVREGMMHVWSGVDHMLFLLALLLPAPLTRIAGAWGSGAGLWRTLREVVKVVTAFTAAHSVTLCLAFFGLVSFRPQWVEVGIALSVFAAAWNNLRPFLPGRAWTMALVFGLVHGLGFAGALRNLALPIHARGVALAAFNVGVELGQLVVVAAVLPLLVAAAGRRWYPRLVMGGASVVIAWLAVLWILERGFGVVIFASL